MNSDNKQIRVPKASKPLKRVVELQPLSRDHHQALLLCFHLKKGIRHNVEPRRMASYCHWHWKSHIEHHFEVEEMYLFPILGTRHKLIREALKHHKLIRAYFTVEDFSLKDVHDLQELLEYHVRYEERVLFEKIQEVATKEQLKICAFRHQACSLDTWKDTFWEE